MIEPMQTTNEQKTIKQQFDEMLIKLSTYGHVQADEEAYVYNETLDLLEKVATEAVKAREAEIIDSVMSLIDGHYDNPNLAGELERYFGITYQEWEKQ